MNVERVRARHLRQSALPLLLLAILLAGNVSGQSAPAAAEQSLSELVRHAILDNLPREFDGENDWGQQREVASGLKFKTGGGKLRIEKRTKAVNDGLWTNYHVTLVDPAQNLRVRVANLRRVAPGRLAATINLSARLQGTARYERWRRGVKMLNFKVDAVSIVEAAVDCEIGFRLLPARLLSDLAIEPKVTGVRLALADIDLARVSRIDGRAAEELGDRLRHTFDKELRARQDDIAARLNATILAHPERLRFSPERLWSLGWAKAQGLLASLARPPEEAARR